MFCHKCGKKLSDNDRFCDNCGATTTVTSKPTSQWGWLRNVWDIIVNLITIGVISGIYSSIYGDFETIVVSLLILIYLSLQSFSMLQGKTIAENAFALDGEFKRIRGLLNADPTDEEIEEVRNARRKFDKSMTKMYINAAFVFIMYLIALFNLLGAI